MFFLQELFYSLKNQAESELMQALYRMREDDIPGMEPLLDSDVEEIVSDFRIGCSHYSLGFSVKFAWVFNFPWVIMVLCHPSLDRAWHWACIIVAKYDAHAGPHDRRTNKFLHPCSPLRQLWDRFVATKIMDLTLAFEVRLFRGVPLSDRPGEAEHVYLKDVAKQNRGTKRGFKYSAARRFDQIREIVADTPTRDKLVAHFMKLGSLKTAVEALGFSQHPAFEGLFAEVGGDVLTSDEAKHGWKTLQDIVYRQDLSLKYTEYWSSRKHHEKQVKTYETKVAHALPASAEEVLMHNALGHFAVVSKAYRLFTVPLVDDHLPISLTSVDQMLGLDVHGVTVDASEDDLLGEPLMKKHKDSTEDGDMAAPRTPVDFAADTRRCFSVLSTRPGRMKTVGSFIHSCRAPQLRQGDVAVTLHDELPNSSRDCLIARLNPKDGWGSGVSILRSFDGFGSVAALQRSVLGWTDAERQVHYSMADVTSSAGYLHGCIKDLYVAAAFPNTVSAVGVRNPPDEAWQALLDLEYVVSVALPPGEGVEGELRLQFTTAGLAAVQSGIAVPRSGPVFVVRSELPLPDRTPFELALTLRERGFQWLPMPHQVQDRIALTFEVGLEPPRLEWYTLGKTLIPQYLLCLLSASSLRDAHGITSIHHYSWHPVRDYTALLDEGKQFVPHDSAAVRRPKRALKGRMLLDDGEELDGDAEPPALEDGRVDRARLGDDQEGGDGHDDVGLSALDLYGDHAPEETVEEYLARAIEDEAELAAMQERAVADPGDDVGSFPGTPTSPAEGPGDAPMPPPSPPPLPPPPGSPPLLLTSPPGPGSPSSSDAEDRPVPRARGGRLPIIRWGCFDIARKRQAGKPDSYEARCPFHRLNAKSGCRKTFEIAHPGDEEVVLNALKWWCNEAKVWTHQRDHLDALDEPLAVPLFDAAALEAGRIEGPAPLRSEVKTDVQLDAEAAARALALRARARGRAGAGRGGRGRRGRGAGPAAPVGAASSSSSDSD